MALNESTVRLAALDLSFNPFLRNPAMSLLNSYLERKTIEQLDQPCKAAIECPVIGCLK